MSDEMTAATIDKAKGKKPTEAERFDFMGEFLDITRDDPRLPLLLEKLAEYKARAKALKDAKDAAFETEEWLKQFMQGYENLRVLGEVKVQWRWKLKTYFDKRKLQRDNMALVEQYTVRIPNGERAFSAKGVTHVE